MANEGWRDVLLMTIRETPNKKKDGAFYGLYVIMRITPDNKCFGVTVRSGESYMMNGFRKYPKEGLNEYDFFALKNEADGESVKACSCGKMRSPTVFDKVRKLLDRRNPPPVPEPEAPALPPPPPPPPPAEVIEDCPF